MDNPHQGPIMRSTRRVMGLGNGEHQSNRLVSLTIRHKPYRLDCPPQVRGTGLRWAILPDMETIMATVEMKKRANSVYVYRMVDGVHEWDFGAPLGVVRCDPAKASAQARHFLLNYGNKQWVQDGGAVSAGDDGKVSIQAKFDGIKNRATLIESGCDNLLQRTPKGEGSENGLKFEAVMRAFDKDAAGVAELVQKLAAKRGIDEGAAFKILASTDKALAAATAIRNERAARAAEGATGADDLLAEIEGA